MMTFVFQGCFREAFDVLSFIKVKGGGGVIQKNKWPIVVFNLKTSG